MLDIELSQTTHAIKTFLVKKKKKNERTKSEKACLLKPTTMKAEYNYLNRQRRLGRKANKKLA